MFVWSTNIYYGMASTSEKSPRGVGELLLQNTGMNEIIGFASKNTDSSDAKRITDFVDGAVAGTSSGSSEHDDKESFRLGIFLHSVSMAMGMPVKDLLNQPLVDITSASPPSSSSSTTPAEAPSFCRTIRSRKFRFRRQQQRPCSRCKVVLEVKNANKIAAFGQHVLIRCEAHAKMIRSWQMDTRPLKRTRSCEGGQ